MTKEQKNTTRQALRRHCLKSRAYDPHRTAWTMAINEAEAYYRRTDPTCAELMRMRFFEGRREEEVLEALHLGRTTYQKMQMDVLSTVAIRAAHYGAL